MIWRIVSFIALAAFFFILPVSCDPMPTPDGGTNDGGGGNGGGIVNTGCSTDDPFDDTTGINTNKPVITPETTGTDGSLFGSSATFSSDGNTVLVGAPSISGGDGAAYVFVCQSDNTWSQPAKLEPTTDFTGDTTNFDGFGYAVALSADGNTALIGAWKDNIFGTFSAGTAYVFTRDGNSWSAGIKLTAEGDASSGDTGNPPVYGNFGTSVALSSDGNTALIGAPRDDDVPNDSGAVYVFTWNGTMWSSGTKLTASDAAGADKFGDSVALSGNTALIGAPKNNRGAAYIFTGSGSSWMERKILTGSDITTNADFGVSVALSGNTALIGAHQQRHSSRDGAGAAYVFTGSENSWSEQAILHALDAAAFDKFGVSVALSGNIALVGARDNDSPASNAGSAYVFTRSEDDSWTQRVKLVADDGAASNKFGSSVMLSDSVSSSVFAVIGSTGGDSACLNCGSAYIFRIRE